MSTKDLSLRIDEVASGLANGMVPPLPAKSRSRLGSDYDNLIDTDDDYGRLVCLLLCGLMSSQVTLCVFIWYLLIALTSPVSPIRDFSAASGSSIQTWMMSTSTATSQRTMMHNAMTQSYSGLSTISRTGSSSTGSSSVLYQTGSQQQQVCTYVALQQICSAPCTWLLACVQQQQQSACV